MKIPARTPASVLLKIDFDRDPVDVLVTELPSGYRHIGSISVIVKNPLPQMTNRILQLQCRASIVKEIKSGDRTHPAPNAP